MAKKLKYVVCVAIDAASDMCVFLVKNKGPEFLIGKVTFPGGKIEEAESAQSAANREMLEETGVNIPENNWELLYQADYPDCSVDFMWARNSGVLAAKQIESEPVFIDSLSAQYLNSKVHGDLYAPDFSQISQLVCSSL